MRRKGEIISMMPNRKDGKIEWIKLPTVTIPDYDPDWSDGVGYLFDEIPEIERLNNGNYLLLAQNTNFCYSKIIADPEYFKDNKNTSLYLSKNVKLIQTDYDDKTSDYVIIKDKEFKKMCDIFYKNIWEEDRDIIIDDKDEIIDILEKELTYVSIINENF